MLRRLTLLVFIAVVALAQAQERIKDVVYTKIDETAFTYDVFKPKTANGKAVIWLVSGGWFSSKAAINADIAKPLNDAGFTVFEVVHGSQPKFKIPEIIKELQRAIRHIRANATAYGVDPAAIGVSGASSGGHLSLMLGGLGDDGLVQSKDAVDRMSDRVEAVVAFMPPTDFLNWGKPGVVPIKNSVLSIFMPAFGVTAATPEDEVKAIGHQLSPIEHIAAQFPPTLLVHGDKDTLVPIQQSEEMDAALGKAKIDHKFVTVPGGGHDAKTILGGFPQMIEWFNSHLTGRTLLK